MAIDLTAVFRVQDRGSSVLQRITRTTRQATQATQQASRASDVYRDSNGRLRNALGRYATASNQAVTSTNRMNTGLGKLRGSASGAMGSLRGVQTTLVGLAGAYLTAHGAASLLNSTIGAAARFEQSEVAIHAIFNDRAVSDEYVKLVESMAIDSPLLNSGEMFAASKSLVAMTKNVGELGDAWSIIERLMVLDPTQGTDGAAFALKEMWQGDSLSLVERFGLNKQELNRIKKLKIPQQIAEINALLDGMGITQATVASIGETTLGYWAQIQERADKFMRTVGNASNGRLGEVLKGVVDMLDSPKVDEFASVLNNKLADAVERVITIGQKMWEWREPISQVAGAIGILFGTLLSLGIISKLLSPIGLLATGISAGVLGFKALYKNSEGFRSVIDGVVQKAKGLWAIFKEGGTGGLLDSLFGEGTSEKVGAIVTGIKDWIISLLPAFLSIKDSVVDIFGTLWTVIKDVWVIVQPLIVTIWEYIKSLGGVIKMVFENIIAPSFHYFSESLKLVWSIAQPILSLLAGLFDVIASVALFLWDMALAPLLGFITGAFSEGFNWLIGILETASGWFEKIGEWTDWAHDKLSDFASFITGIKVPDWITNGITTAVDYVGGIFKNDDKIDGSHYSGLNYVPYNGYTAQLHKGEQVLTAQEAKEYRNGSQASGITISGNTFNIREEKDIKLVALELAKLIEREAILIG